MSPRRPMLADAPWTRSNDSALVVSTLAAPGAALAPPPPPPPATVSADRLLDAPLAVGLWKRIPVAPPVLLAPPPLVPPPLLVAPPLLVTPLLEDWLVEELLDDPLLLSALLAGVKPLIGAVVVELGKEVSLPPAAESAEAAAVPAPGGPTLMTMSPNCSGVLSRPRMSIGNWLVCRTEVGGCPVCPGAAWMLWLRTALATSWAVMPRDASFRGSTQIRMA